MDRFEKDQALFSAITEIVDEKIPFNKVIGMKLDDLSFDHVSIRFEMRDDLIGNFMRGTLHGGVISSVIDVTGGLAAFMGIQQKKPEDRIEKNLAKFEKLGTIDLRIDYLRPGLGKWFISTGYTLRTGNKVAVTRIELNNDQNDLVAVGTGSYTVS